MTTNHHTPISTGAPANASTFNTPLGQLDGVIDTALTNASTALTDVTHLKSGAGGFTQLNLSTTSTLTISSGQITITRSRHLVDTEASATYDDLDTINGGVAGDVLVVQSVTAARVVVVKHNTGNIFLNGMDVHLDNPLKALTLLCDGTRWVLVGNPPQRIDRRQMRALFVDGGIHYAGLPVCNTINGTATAVSETDGQYTQYASPASVNNHAGLFADTNTFMQARYNPALTVWMRTSSNIAVLRCYIGFFSATPMTTDDLGASTIQGFGFRYSTAVGDSGFRPVTSNGTTQTAGAVIDTLAVNSAYKLRCWLVGSVAYFSINDSVPVSIATNLPASTTAMTYTIRYRTLEGVAKNILLKQVLLELD